MKRLLFGIAVFSLSAQGLASDDYDTGRDVLRIEEALKTAEGRQRVMLRAVGGMVHKASQQLRREGLEQKADLLLSQWEQIREAQSFFDIGDHAPLNQWLADVYGQLEGALGKSVLEKAHLDDVNIMNYAIPVVFTPEFEWGRDEYQLHFVPFAGTVGYWAVKTACEAAVSVPKVCGLAAKAGEFAIRRYVAPDVSDDIYETAHR